MQFNTIFMVFINPENPVKWRLSAICFIIFEGFVKPCGSFGRSMSCKIIGFYQYININILIKKLNFL